MSCDMTCGMAGALAAGLAGGLAAGLAAGLAMLLLVCLSLLVPSKKLKGEQSRFQSQACPSLPYREVKHLFSIDV